jgi:GNAT superfamily N-acetyltransferase
MAVYDRKLIDVEIVDLNEALISPVALLHLRCNPLALDALLGPGCISEALRRHCIGPGRDMTARVALKRSDGRIAGYCLSRPNASLRDTGALLTPGLVLRHLNARVCRSPLFWKYGLQFVMKRLRRLWARRNHRAAGAPVAEDSFPRPMELIVRLEVDPDCRFSNVGFDIILDMENQARQRGARRVFGRVHSLNKRALRLYLHIGHQLTFPKPDADGFYFTHKDLKPQDEN